MRDEVEIGYRSDLPAGYSIFFSVQNEDDSLRRYSLSKDGRTIASVMIPLSEIEDIDDSDNGKQIYIFSRFCAEASPEDAKAFELAFPWKGSTN